MTLLKKHIPSHIKASSIITRLAAALLLLLFTGGMVQAQYVPESGEAAYTAEIEELNANLTDEEISGQASFIVADGQLHITIVASGLLPSMMHLQHIHGFKSGSNESACPDPGADSNGDGIVDLIETHEASGVTLVPFNGDPVALKIKSSSYPIANEKGLLTYQISVSLDVLESATQNSYDIDELSLEDRVLYIHGVPEDTSLPESVQSLPGVPAQVTVPLACGEIEAL